MILGDGVQSKDQIKDGCLLLDGTSWCRQGGVIDRRPQPCGIANIASFLAADTEPDDGTLTHPHTALPRKCLASPAGPELREVHHAETVQIESLEARSFVRRAARISAISKKPHPMHRRCCQT